MLTEIKNKRLGVERDRRKIKSCLDRLILDDNEIYLQMSGRQLDMSTRAVRRGAV